MPGAVVQLPMVAGAVVISYNLPMLKQPLKLDGPTTANIFLGKIKTWNDPAIAKLNAGATLPSLPITVAHRSDGSGTTFIFTNYLKSVSPEWASQIGAGKSVKWPNGQIGAAKNSGVAAIIKQKPGNVGYLELAYAKQSNISYAWLKNKAGQVVEPTVKSTTAAAADALAALQKDVRTSIANADGADAYPIAGFTYILLSKQQKDADKGKALTDFLKWAITDGQQDAEALFYAPLPPELVTVNQQAIDSIK
jgi:phosphate transport system substrate-binding protein